MSCRLQFCDLAREMRSCHKPTTTKEPAGISFITQLVVPQPLRLVPQSGRSLTK